MKPTNKPWLPHPTCEHGERRDLTTRDGYPVCALCRRAKKFAERYGRPITTPPPRTDARALAAHDDTLWDDDEEQDA